MKDFAAIDFETANQWRSSVCSVGVVIVKGGKVVDKFYSFIYPRPGLFHLLDNPSTRINHGGRRRCTAVSGCVETDCA